MSAVVIVSRKCTVEADVSYIHTVIQYTPMPLWFKGSYQVCTFLFLLNACTKTCKLLTNYFHNN